MLAQYYRINSYVIVYVCALDFVRKIQNVLRTFSFFVVAVVVD